MRGDDGIAVSASAAEFVKALAARGVTIAVDGDRLRCEAPAGVLTADLRAAIATRKPELLRHFAPVQLAGRPRHEHPPLSFAQERLWLLHQLDPADSAYHVPLVIRLRGRMHVAALQQALTEVVRRHEVLRTVYPTAAGRPYQRVLPAPRAASLAVVELGAVEPEQADAVAWQAIEAEARRPFELTREPAVRAQLLRTAAGDARLVLTRHHIVTDGWSLGLLVAELAGLLKAYQAGRPAGLPEPRLQYADYAAWQRELDDDGALDGGIAWWRRTLEGAPAELQLVRAAAADVARAPAGRVRLELDVAATEALHALAARSGTTVFAVLVAAYGLVLAHAAGQPEVVIGFPVAGRLRPELETLIGSFVNMLPLRVGVEHAGDFSALLRGAHEALMGALEHEDVPLERIIEAVRPERAVSRSPLFEAVLTLQNTPLDGVSLPGIDAALEEAPPVAAKYALALTASERDGALDLLLEYDEEAVAAPLACELAARTRTVLALAGRNPTQSCAAIMRAAAGEPGGRAPSVRHAGRRLERLFEAQAARTPDAVAVSCGDARLTYAGLDSRAERLAVALRLARVSGERRVAICAEPSLDVVVGIVATLKAGGAYVPLDHGDPAERQRAIVADAGADVVLASSSLAGRFADAAARVIALDDPAAFAHVPCAGHPAGLSPDSLAYVIYTSGSTGAPKGVMVSHENASRLFDATRPLFGFTSGDVWSLAHSFSFDFSVWELWGALASGGRVVVVPDPDRRSVPEVWRTAVREGVTILSQTPSSFRQLARVALDDGRATAPPALRSVVLGGESCDPSSIRAWFDAFGDERPGVANMYGITETTVHATYRRLARTDAAVSGHSPIGRPLEDLGADVVGRWGSPVPAGGEGELLVSGAGVTRGYLGRPGLTAARFVPAANGVPGARAYTSGDVVRELGDGELEYIHRLDQQVKLRGHRIELGEVEAAVRAHPAVESAAVMLRGAGERAYLAAYVVAARGVTPAPDELRRAAAERLPRYMVPSAFVALDRLPLTRNGKLDVDALPEPELLATLGGERVLPRTDTERALAELWTELLDVPEVGVYDGFFELGADSLLVTQFHARLPRLFGIDLPMRRVFQALDIASLAAAIDELRRADAAELSALLDVVENMSDEELRQRLS